ncbi:MAG TPA: multicopper oxidase domain-containing protein [Actinomycetes bacterium]
MRALALKKTRALLVLVVAAAALPLAGSTASAAAVPIELCATAGTVTLPGETGSIPIWGFGIPATAGDCSTATASLPGPVLTVNQGDVVTVTLRNALPAGTGDVTHALRFEVPGITFDPGPTDVAVGAAPASITFTANAPGTYQYQSSGDGGRQEAMGLYGALIVRSGTPNQAYNDPSTAYDVEATLVLSAVDPSFNAAPDTFELHNYRATSWLINGTAYPDTPPITASAGQRVLLRYVNAGFDNTSMLLLGMHERVLARAARLLNNPFDAAAETIPAGGTEDAIATVPSGSPPSANGFPLLNRQLHLTNGLQTGTSPTPAAGGMLTFIKAP